MSTPETIVAAAIRVASSDERRAAMWLGSRCYPDHITLTCPPPGRHHTLLHIANDLGLPMVQARDQGFITSSGRYVGREEAYAIVQAAGQEIIRHPHSPGYLFSEDLW